MPISRILACLAHPDDTDNYCAYLLNAFVKSGKEIHLCSFTRGEHGLGGNRDPDKESFRGNRLGKIRSRELTNAARFLGIPASQIHFLGIEDSKVPLYKYKAYLQAKNVINSIMPDLLLIPEFTKGYYKHPDHVYVGMISFLIARKLGIQKIMFYHSLENNYYFPVNDLALGRNAITFHKSQADFFRFLRPLYVNVEQIIHGLHVQGNMRAEGYRLSNSNEIQETNFIFTLFGNLFQRLFGVPTGTRNYPLEPSGHDPPHV